MKRHFPLLVILMTTCGLGLQGQTADKLRTKSDAASITRLAVYHTLGCQGAELDSARALQLFEQAAQLGSAEAYAHLAGFYLRGSVVERDTAHAVTLAQKAAQQGSGYGWGRLAVMNQEGIGMPVNLKKADECYRQAEAAGDAYGLYYAGMQYNFGECGKKIDDKKALALFEKSAKLGCLGSYYYAASIAEELGQEKKARQYLEKGLAYNDPDCRTYLAITHILSLLGYARDEAAAERLLLEVLHQNPKDSYAARTLALLYLEAKTPALRDTARAIGVLEQCAQAGSGNAYHILGQLYGDKLTGRTPQEREKARTLSRDYYLKAAQMGFKDAYYQVALNYLSDGNPDEARRWLDKGVADQQYTAAHAYAIAHADGEFGEVDYAEAMRYAELSAEWGSLGVYDWLYHIYLDSDNHEMMMQTARRAIEAGNLDGYAWLGMCYGDEDNQKKALKTVEKGYKLGNAKCRDILINRHNNMGNYKKSYAIWERQNDPEAWYNMATLMLSGKVPSKDIATPLALLNRSADGGYNEALNLLGYIYSNEDFGLQNTRVAIGYYQRLADAGDPEGLFMIGNVYEHQNDSANCLLYYRRAAALDHGDAWRFLGEFYMNGHWLPCDSTEAFRCYHKAMECGENAGTDFVAQCYLRGVGVEKDTLAALPYLRRAAEGGSGRAAAFMGNVHRLGLFGFEANIDSALYFYRIGSRVDDPDCDYQIGSYLINQGEIIRALGYIFSAARNGNHEAIMIYGECLMNGLGMEANPEQAYQMFEQMAHEWQDGEAYMKLGAYRVYGNGCQQDYYLAKRYFDTAAYLGSVTGIYNLAQCYKDGIGCEPDSVLYLATLTRAADSGSTRALNELGDYYEAREDYTRAVDCYQRGVALGNYTAMCNLGVCYQEGNGVILNSKKAYDLFLEAAEGGSSRGMYHVAMCYMDEVYVTDDLDQAVLWFSRAAEQGHTLSNYYLGMLYATGAENSSGQRLAADKKKAKQYLKEAAEAGFEPANEMLKKL